MYPQQKGELQLTLGTLIDRTRDDRAALMPLSIEYGLTDKWQVAAGWDGYTQFHHNPFARLRSARASVGTKYSFMNIGHSRVHAAVGMDVEFPDAGAFEDEAESDLEFEPFLSVAADLSRRVTLFGSAGISVSREDATRLPDQPDDPGTLSVGALAAFHRATIALEYTSRSDNLPWRLDGSPLITPSIVLHPGHQWELSAGLPIGVRHGTHRPGLAFHVIKDLN